MSRLLPGALRPMEERVDLRAGPGVREGWGDSPRGVVLRAARDKGAADPGKMHSYDLGCGKADT